MQLQCLNPQLCWSGKNMMWERMKKENEKENKNEAKRENK
jgi:hypothetical protein